MSSYLKDYRYHNLLDFILSGRNKTSRKIENNTIARIELDDYDIQLIKVKLHNTDIGTIFANNTIILNSGGWMTFTTKDRMNKILNHTEFRIYQENGIWYVYRLPFSLNECYGYQDNIQINPNGTIENYLPDVRELEKKRKQITSYVKRFIRALVTGKVESPNAGDCWYCAMRDSSSNIPLGESTGDISHLESHMKENYFVGSLLWRAIELYPVSQYAMWELGDIWQKGKLPNDRFSVLSDQVSYSLKKYLFSRFNLPN